MSIDEYKQILTLKSDTRLNIYFASWTARELIGLATFPWEKNVYSVLGKHVFNRVVGHSFILSESRLPIPTFTCSLGLLNFINVLKSVSGHLPYARNNSTLCNEIQ